MNKTEIRERGRTAREALSREEIREKSRRIARRLYSRPEYRAARTIFCYLDFGHEVETTRIVRTALGEGKRIAVPLVLAGKRALRSVMISNLERDLAPGFWNIREPIDRDDLGIDPREIDLALIPGTAFDLAGNRLGRGACYYDRFLNRLRSGTPRLGLAFDCQLVERIIPDPHDVAMDLIITEDRVIKPGATDNTTE